MLETYSPSQCRTDTSDSDSDSDSDSSSSSDSEDNDKKEKAVPHPTDDKVETAEDHEDEPTSHTSPDQVKTLNEVVDVKVNIPDISEVGEQEELEKVGEVMSIIDKVVIIKGVPSPIQNRVNERALDSDTLLVFGDRKVLGYVCFSLSSY